MKKCPYCAEEIQDEAIVCRYCERDLPKSHNKPAREKTIWEKAAVAAAVISVLYIIEQFINPPYDLVIRLTGGLVVTFFFSMIISAGIIWLWEKFGAGTFIGLSILIGLLIVLLYVGFPLSNPRAPALVSTPTQPPPTPTRTPILSTPTASALQALATQGIDCVRWSNVTRQDIGSSKCVYGFITQIFNEYEAKASFTQVEFDLNNPNALVVNITEETIRPNSASLVQGACFIATGTVEFEGHHLYINAVRYITSLWTSDCNE